MAYRRRSGTKGRKCVRRKRVRVRGQGYALRCAKYGPKRGYRKSTSRRRKRKATGMARRGSRCVRRKRVYSKALRRRVWRCASFR